MIYTACMLSCRSIITRFSLFLILFFAFTLGAGSVSAQDFPLGIARYYPITGDINDGDIVAIVEDHYEKTVRTYQENIIGIYVENPSLEFRPAEIGDDKAVLSSGEAFVNVSTVNGFIKRGDVLSSSSIPGTAMLAKEKGFVIGTALENYDESDPEKIGKLRVSLLIEDNRSASLALTEEEGIRLIDIFSASKLALYESPSESFKYIVAALVVIISFVFGFITFKKVAVKGVEAIGRNPLASRMIGAGILLNLVITVSIILAGLVLAYFIITL